MARKTFISYKYSEARDVRDRIIRALGEDAKYYMGETSDSPDMTDEKTEIIKNSLKDMIFGTSVTIVVVSPNMVNSKWIPWEIEYSLSCYSRDGRTSHQNGVVAVIKKVNGGYSWVRDESYDYDKGFSVVHYKPQYLPQIIIDNMYNSTPPKLACGSCRKYSGYSRCADCSTYDYMQGSYITMVTEDDFLSNPEKYIENAYDKSQHLEKFYTTKKSA